MELCLRIEQTLLLVAGRKSEKGRQRAKQTLEGVFPSKAREWENPRGFEQHTPSPPI